MPKTLSPAVALLLLAAALARAACYEVQGCTNTDMFSERFLLREASCDILWQIRNQIYKENGYCFRTPRDRNLRECGLPA